MRISRSILRLSATATFLLGSGAAVAADGDVAIGFGGGWIPVSGAESAPFFSATDSVAGTADGGVLYSSGKALTVWKYTAAGLLDASFGTGGIASSTLKPPADFGLGTGRGMVTAPNGDVFVMAALEGKIEAGVRLCKFNSNGQPVAFPFVQAPCVDRIFPGVNTSSNGHSPHSIALGPEGSVWILGINGDLVRFLPSGQVDPAFVGGRFFLPNFVQQQVQAYGLSIDQDGSAYIAGQAVENQSLRGYAAKIVIGPNGPQLHPSFGNGGVRLVTCGNAPVTTPFCAFGRVAARANDVIFYGVGYYLTGSGTAHHAVLARLDRSIGVDVNPVLVMPNLGGADVISPAGIAVQASGDIIISGTSSSETMPHRAFVARVSAHCGGQPLQLDTAKFGAPNGWGKINYGAGVSSSGGSVALGMDRIYIGGNTINQPQQFTLAAFEDGESVTDGIFANGFEGCD